eukprot:scaffold5342_cov104-Cylindrotheca_fusiformis.AAC.5
MRPPTKQGNSIRLLVAVLLHVSVISFQPPQGIRRPPLQKSLFVARSNPRLKDNESSYVESFLPTKDLVNAADTELRLKEIAQHADMDDKAALNRRLFMGAALLGASGILATGEVASAETVDATESVNTPDFQNGGFERLKWTSTPVNKRTGVTVFDAEKYGYNVQFVTYLSRFLLSFDLDCQKWWYARASDIPRRASADEVQQIRLKQFGAFSASVEVGLQEYRDKDGPARLMQSLLSRYCPDMETVRREREEKGLPKLSESQELKERREIKEARRQIALLFGLMEKNQPVESINKLLAAIDNGSIMSVTVEDGGTGYAPGYGSPTVVFPPPKAGADFKTATGRAKLQPNGKILRFDIVDRGFGYQKPPTVTVSPPGADRGVSIPGSKPATAKAFVFKSGPNKGRLERLQLVDSGEGYIGGEKIRVSISPPDLPPEQGGIAAKATAVLELQVASIEIVDGGTGYAVEKQIPIYVDPPPFTARINMNDPLEAGIIDPSQPLPMSRVANARMRQQIPEPDDPKSLTSLVGKVAKNDGAGGGGNCIGRACYDKPVIAFGTAQAETSSFSEFRMEMDAREAVDAEEALVRKRIISATSAGTDSQMKQSPFWNGGPSSSSAQLLTLIPAGIGLEYDRSLGRFVLKAGSDFLDINSGSTLGASNRPLDPEFGPRGRSPIERDITLNLASFLRFCLSGAICASGAHLTLTPLDVVKTKIQTDPENYPGVGSAFKKVVADRGIGGFFDGWAPTFAGFFFWGGATYSTTELLRRYFTDSLGSSAIGLEAPIILAASAIGAALGTVIICPFESIRIRSVSQPGFGSNLVDVTTRMVKEEGVSSLFSAVPPMLFKEVPFNTAKFLVFSLVTKLLYDSFPAAQEDIQLSLAVSLAGGVIGGLVAAIVSNPADATISEMKKSQTKMSPIDAFKGIVDKKGGYSNLFRGLPIRMAFYPIIVSMQFFVFDSIRLYLNIGSDDLKVYLDVLGGALKDAGNVVGPA